MNLPRLFTSDLLPLDGIPRLAFQGHLPLFLFLPPSLPPSIGSCEAQSSCAKNLSVAGVPPRVRVRVHVCVCAVLCWMSPDSASSNAQTLVWIPRRGRH